MAKSSAVPESNSPSFEHALTRLETIVQDMDSSTLSIDELIGRYEEGAKLVQICEKKLKEVERRIEIITRETPDTPVLKEFKPAAEEDETQPPTASRSDASLF